MNITILTLFPEMFAGPLNTSIIKRAQDKQKVTITYLNIRDFGIGTHKMVDDTPYGGGVGMVLRVDVVHEAIKHALQLYPTITKEQTRILLTSASGKLYKQAQAKEYASLKHLIIICGHYEGVDARILNFIDEEISIGDFVLTGGELPAMLITDSVVRLLDGVITEGATEDESFSETNNGLLEYPHYTRPRTYEGHDVPEVLLNGDHKKIHTWRHEESKTKTKHIRPELIEKNEE